MDRTGVEVGGGGGQRAVAVWLIASACTVLLVLVVGGITRLTHSGLSIVEWQPLIGALPPMSEAEWARVFALYQSSPEFQQVNFDMTLEGFQGIFWWEWAHRLLGRTAGLVFLLPLLWFVWKRRVRRDLGWRLFGIFLLGGAQGALGWYMVASGLVRDPHVSQYRLTAHLSMALILIGSMLWLAFGRLALARGASAPAPAAVQARAPVARAARLVALAVFLMAMTGGMVAGTHAGLVYNTFPLMDGGLVPHDLLALDPGFRNFLENPAAIQFVHRMFAWLLIVAVPALAIAVLQAAPGPRVRGAVRLLLAAFVLQVGLGISTLLTYVALPLAVAHQAGAVLLLAASLWLAHCLGETGER
jgi:cytochrome c oxidase assembly protein subunit 15